VNARCSASRSGYCLCVTQDGLTECDEGECIHEAIAEMVARAQRQVSDADWGVAKPLKRAERQPTRGRL
jgi:hypothetical protein